MEQKVRPIEQWECLEDRIIIKPDVVPKMTEGGLFIPESIQERERPAQGTIINLGPGIPSRTYYKFVKEEDGKRLFEETKTPLKIGDVVKYAKQAGLPVQCPVTKEYHLLMRTTDVWVVV